MANTVHAAAAKGYQRQASAYASARPSYPPVALQQIKALAPDTATIHVLDLAAGTGIMTKLLAETVGYKHVTAVEPVDAMREKLQSMLPQVPAYNGTSWSIPQADQSQDMVVAAQAFHWFADVASLREIHRVLKPNGQLVLIWNTESRSRSRWVCALRDCYGKLDEGVPQYFQGRWKDVFDTHEASKLFKLPFQQRSYVNDILATKDDVYRRIMTKSFVASQTDETRKVLQKELEAVLDDPENQFQPNADGYAVYPYDTDLIWMQKNDE